MKRNIVFALLIMAVSFSQAQQLDVLIKEALENNPNINAFELKYQIAQEQPNEANTLPNTQFGVGFFVSEPETRTGAQRFRVSASQMLPSFGSITARENYLNSLADVLYEDISVERRRLAAEVSQLYYSLYAIQANQEVISENIDLLKSYEELALNSVKVGKASAVDVLRLQMRQNELDQTYQTLGEKFKAEQAAINSLLNRDTIQEVMVPNEVIMPKEKLSINDENLNLHPELTKYDKLYRSVEQSELLNQKESNPMIGFGLDYIAVSERPNMDFSDNGKDILMPMINLSIPIFTNKYKSKTKQNELLQNSILLEKENRENILRTRLEKAISGRNEALISYDLQSKNLAQAKDAERILIKSYESGTIDFNDVLEIQELQLKFQLKLIESVKSFFIQSTVINYLTQ